MSDLEKNAKSTVVMVGNSLIRLTVEHGGIKCEKVKEDDVPDEILLRPTQIPVAKMIKEVVEESREELLERAKEGFSNAVLAALGFEKAWGNNGWKVDNCNNRNSTLIDIIKDDVLKFFNENSIDEIELTDEEQQELHAAYREEYIRMFRYNLTSFARDKALKDAYKINEQFSDAMCKAIRDEVVEQLWTEEDDEQ